MNALIKRIGLYADIEPDYFDDIAGLPHQIETRQAGQDIVITGEKVDFVFVIESGWAMRYRMLDDGRRQIINFMLPGDCFDLMAINRATSDHNVAAATAVTFRRIKGRSFLAVIAKNATLASAFWWAAIQEEGILREQIIRVGRRSAKERLGHLILELNRRLNATTGRLDTYLPLPIPQALLADSLGLSIVHISRTLAKLRAMGLIHTSAKGIEILNRDALSEMCDFDPKYLRIEKMRI